MDQVEDPLYPRAITDSALINSESQMPVIEPVLPILDEWARDVNLNACYTQRTIEKRTYVLNEAGEPVYGRDNEPVYYMELQPMHDKNGNPIIICKWPDIVVLASTGLGHLDGLSHFTWEQGMSFLLDWEGYNLDPLIDKYWREPDALNVIYSIKSSMSRAVIGGSIEGASQNFLVRYRGSDRTINLRREGERTK